MYINVNKNTGKDEAISEVIALSQLADQEGEEGEETEVYIYMYIYIYIYLCPYIYMYK
jgi:hypothetical protein